MSIAVVAPQRLTRRAALAALGACAGLPAAQATGVVEVRVTDEAERPLPGAVVFLESPEARALVKPMTGVEIAQEQRRFMPAVSLVTVGSAVSFPNRDVVRHHVYSFSPAKRFEIKLYVGTPAQPVVFDQPGIAVLGCNIHDQMAAWVVIVETPWHGRTDAQGLWRAPVPPGRFRLRAWHPEMAVGATPSDLALAVDGAGARAAVKLAVAR